MPGAYHSWDVWSKGHGLWRPLSQKMTLAELRSGKHKGNTWMVGCISTPSSFFLPLISLYLQDLSIMEAKSERGMSVTFIKQTNKQTNTILQSRNYLC